MDLLKRNVREVPVDTSEQSNVLANHTHTHTSMHVCSEKSMACIFLILADLTWEHIITLNV